MLYLHLIYFRAIVGEMDESIDSRLDLSSLRAEPLNAVQH